MNHKYLKYLLLLLTVGMWVLPIAVIWQPKPSHRGDFMVYCCRMAVWMAQASIAAMLIPLAYKRAIGLCVIAIIVPVVSYAFNWPDNPAVEQSDQIVTASLYQFIAILPVSVLFGWFGFCIVRLPEKSASDLSPSRQFTLRSLFQWTIAAALCCLLVRLTDRSFLRSTLVATFFFSGNACLVCLITWAGLSSRGILWRSGISFITVVVFANIFTLLTFVSGAPSASMYVLFFGFPLFLLWLTCITLRAFGWQLMRRKSQPLQPAEAEPVSENA